MPHMPFDCTRCAGVRDDAGHLVHPCNKCIHAILDGRKQPHDVEIV